MTASQGLLLSVPCKCCPLAADGISLSTGTAIDAVVQVAANQHGKQLSVNSGAAEVLFSGDVHALTGWRGLRQTLFVSHLHQDACVALHINDQRALVSLLELLTPPGEQQQKHGQNGQQNGAATDVANGVHTCAHGQPSTFEMKTDKGSADQYFAYYGMIQHQQNMLQDYVRTGMYFNAITQNSADFRGKVVMDVGAGSGILSLFAAQAGARKVLAVEASGMARFARQLADGNPRLGQVIEVVQSKVEELQLQDKVDVLVSEPMGTLLVNERMLETYLYARDHFLQPGGKMFPQVGRIHVSAFTDEVLHSEVAAKAIFWTQDNFYNIDVTPLYSAAVETYFAQVVVDAMDPGVLVSTCATHILDFSTCTEAQLHDITIPLQLNITAPGPCVVHGVATWFDVLFPGSQNTLWLSTAPGLPTTHWFQLRCVLRQPILVPGPGCTLTGVMRLIAHRRQSYDVHLTLQGPSAMPGAPPQISSGTYDLKEPYYRQLTTAWWQGNQQQ